MAFRRRRREPEAPSAPDLAPLSLSDSQWRGQQLETARKLVEHYCGGSALPPSLAQLDATITAWHADDADRAEITLLASAVGVTLGHHLATTVGLSWVLATDTDGAELALHDEAGDEVLYPCRLVARGLVDDQRNFVEPLFADVVTRTRRT